MTENVEKPKKSLGKKIGIGCGIWIVIVLSCHMCVALISDSESFKNMKIEQKKTAEIEKQKEIDEANDPETQRKKISDNLEKIVKKSIYVKNIDVKVTEGLNNNQDVEFLILPEYPSKWLFSGNERIGVILQNIFERIQNDLDFPFVVNDLWFNLKMDVVDGYGNQKQDIVLKIRISLAEFKKFKWQNLGSEQVISPISDKITYISQALKQYINQ